jgi:hypothetical protein
VAKANPRAFILREVQKLPHSRYAIATVAAASLILVAVPAARAESLSEAIKAADAKYLDAKPPVTTGKAPAIEAGSGEAEEEPAPKEISDGKLKAALTYRVTTSDEGDITRVPVVTIFEDGQEIAKFEGDENGSSDPPLAVQIAEIDPANTEKEVVVSFYTGGAHCCSDTSVLTKAKDGSSWKTVTLGEFDGGPMLATEIAGDGRYVFETRDNAFLYAFGCYACSTAPLKILAVEDGEAKDLSDDPRFRPIHASYLRDMIADVPDSEAYGFLAGYVGEKIRLGDGKQAWEIMLAHYDKASDWGLDICDRALDADGACPGTETRVTFPVALERMLNENGYKFEK